MILDTSLSHNSSLTIKKIIDSFLYLLFLALFVVLISAVEPLREMEIRVPLMSLMPLKGGMEGIIYKKGPLKGSKFAHPFRALKGEIGQNVAVRKKDSHRVLELGTSHCFEKRVVMHNN